MIFQRIGLISCAVLRVPHEHAAPQPHTAIVGHPDTQQRLLLTVEQLDHGLLQLLRRYAFALVEVRVD